MYTISARADGNKRWTSTVPFPDKMIVDFPAVIPVTEVETIVSYC